MRSEGYHNVGAYNVMNTVDFKWGFLAGSLDAFKGMATLVIVSLLGCTYPTCIWAGLAAIVGHNHPIWLGFEGGRGVSVAIGLLIGIIPLETIIGVAASFFAFHWIRRVNKSVAIGFIAIIVITVLRGTYPRIQLLLVGEIIVICASYIPRGIRMMLGTSWYLEEIRNRKKR